MKNIFIICAALFAAMYVAAETTLARPPQDGKVHLVWATDPAPARAVQTQQFAAMFPGYQASVNANATGDATKVIVQCATGSGPDLIDMQQDAMQAYAQTGILLDLTPYAKKMGFDPSLTYPAVKDAVEVEGKQYGFPCNVWANAVIYNKKIFDDHGVAYPKPNWTYDDFERIGREIQERPSKSGQKHVAVANYNNAGLVIDLMTGYGGTYFTPDGLHAVMDSPQVIAAAQRYIDMMYKSKIIPTPADTTTMSAQGGWGTGGITWFSGGKAAMIIIGRWYILQVGSFPEMKGNMGTVLLPRVGDRPSSGAIGARAAGINAKSPHWRESLKFLQYLASPEYSKVIVHDGDSLPPSPKVAATGQDLVNDIVPDPAFHETFITAAKNARPLRFSPFFDASITNRWMYEYVEKMENRILTPPQAMRELNAHINEQIRINLERRPDLQKKYEQVTGKKYTPDWS